MNGKRRRLLTICASVSLAVAACASTSAPASPSRAPTPSASAPVPSVANSPGSSGALHVRIGIDLPLSGGDAPNGIPTEQGVELAIDTIHIPAIDISVESVDDAVDGKHDAQQGAKNVDALAKDAQVLFVVGPFNSSVAQAEIPVSNAAGLMQCSPSNTLPGLTTPWAGIDPTSFRPARPDRIAYVRVSSSDRYQGVAVADIAFNTLGARTAFIADDTGTYGTGVADDFEQAFTRLGGRVLLRESIPSQTADFGSYVATVLRLRPAFVFYGGVTPSGLGVFRRQMAQQGLSSIPFGGGDGILDGSASDHGSFLEAAGADGDRNTYSATAGARDFPGAQGFAAAYTARFGAAPGPYSAAAYACAQVFLQALAVAGPGERDLARLREVIRAFVADPTHIFNTVLGSFHFDRNGDRSQQIMSYYAYDETSRDWVFMKQRDLAPGASPLP